MGVMQSNPNGLTALEQAFVDAYITCGENATAAAEKAGTGLPYNVVGYQILARPHVQLAISAQRQELRAKTATADFVLAKLVDIASSTATDAYEQDDDGELRLKRLKDIKVPVQQVSIRRNRNGEQEVSIKTPPQTQALEMLGRHLALFTDNVHTTVSLTDSDRDAKRARLEFLAARIQEGLLGDDPKPASGADSD